MIVLYVLMLMTYTLLAVLWTVYDHKHGDRSVLYIGCAVITALMAIQVCVLLVLWLLEIP